LKEIGSKRLAAAHGLQASKKRNRRQHPMSIRESAFDRRGDEAGRTRRSARSAAEVLTIKNVNGSHENIS
jgi:hypothetical protein